MSVTLTSQPDYSRILFQTVAQDNSINVYCYDGQLTVSSLLLAAVSPIICEYGKHYSEKDCCNSIDLIIPDFSTSEVHHFIQLLTHSNGSLQPEDGKFITQMLILFGQDIKKIDFENDWTVDTFSEPVDNEKWLETSQDDSFSADFLDDSIKLYDDESSIENTEENIDNKIKKSNISFKSKFFSNPDIFFVSLLSPGIHFRNRKIHQGSDGFL